jgi:hypothetical protein
MNTQENNKLIAEFMGARPITFNDGKKGHTFWNEEGVEGRYGAFPDGSTNYFDYDKGYNTDWDWLMSVVEKIEQVHEGVPQELIHLSLFSTRDEVYNAVVEFINQCNKN